MKEVPLTLSELHAYVKTSSMTIAAMHVGEITERPPLPVREATIACLDSDPLGYTEAGGLLPLREHIARDILERKGIRNSSPEQIVCCPGVKQGLFYVFRHLVKQIPDQSSECEIIIPSPYWGVYEMQLRELGVKVVQTPLTAQGTLDIDHIKRLVNTRTCGIVLCTPHNPTGSILPKQNIIDLAEILPDHVKIISDEIYEGLDYQTCHTAVASIMPTRTYTLGGFSKLYCMTGYRLGWISTPTRRDAIEMTRLQANLCTCPNSLAQRTALRLMESNYAASDTVKQMVACLDRRRLELIALFGSCIRGCPRGAFYVWIHVPDSGGIKDLSDSGVSSDLVLCMQLLEKGVAIAAGSYFNCPGHIRISYACTEQDYQKGLEAFQQLSWINTT